MSTPLVALAVILGLFAIVIIPFMFVKADQQPAGAQQDHVGDSGKPRKKKKKR